MPTIDMSFFGLNRPEYVPAPELTLSDLIWSRATKDTRNRMAAEAPGGLAYGSVAAKPDTSVCFTKPKPGSPEFGALVQFIGEEFGIASAEAEQVVTVISGEIEMYASQKTTRSVAIPLTIELALLQDRRGITGKANPPNLALIMEQIYALGGGRGLASQKYASALRLAGSAGLPAWVADITKLYLPRSCGIALSEILESSGDAKIGTLRSPSWLKDHGHSPFHWFSAAWSSLNENGWIEVMPRRRWTDWATCVARTAVAMSYLFEMHTTYRFVSALVTDESPEDVISRALKMSQRLFSWDDRKSKPEVDVGPMINLLSSHGATCLAFLQELRGRYSNLPAPADYDDDPDGICGWLVEARKVVSHDRKDIEGLLSDSLESSVPSSAKNIRETIRYSLLARGGTGSSDLYGMLQTAGRYTWVAPGQEWLVTVASLCSTAPGRPARLSDLLGGLRSLGIGVSATTVVGRLESFGLARSSHDADEALEIQPAF